MREREEACAAPVRAQGRGGGRAWARRFVWRASSVSLRWIPVARGYDPAMKRATAIGGEGAPPPAIAWDSLRDELRDGGGALGAVREERVLLRISLRLHVPFACACARAHSFVSARAPARAFEFGCVP